MSLLSLIYIQLYNRKDKTKMNKQHCYVLPIIQHVHIKLKQGLSYTLAST